MNFNKKNRTVVIFGASGFLGRYIVNELLKNNWIVKKTSNGSKRWIKQFRHKGKDDSLKYKQDISAISGATISVKSMIETVNLFLDSVNKLNQNSVL